MSVGERFERHFQRRVISRFIGCAVLIGGFLLLIIGFALYLFLFEPQRFRALVHDPASGDVVQDLASPNRRRRQAALQQLAQGRTDRDAREVVREVKTLLQDKYPSVRLAAIDALAEWGGPEDASDVIRFLESGRQIGADRLIGALGKFGGEEASAYLAGQLADDWNRPLASKALLDVGPSAEARVIAVLSQSDLPTQLAAVNVLEQIGTEAALDSLDSLDRSLAEEDRSLMEAVAAAVKAIRARAAVPDEINEGANGAQLHPSGSS